MDSTQMCLSKDIVFSQRELDCYSQIMFTVPLVPNLVPRPRGRRETWPGYEASLIPRPCPVMRKNGLVNQVKFLRLVGTLVTVHRSKHSVPNLLKRMSEQTQKNYCCKESAIYIHVINDDLAISLVLANNFVHQTISSPGGTHETNLTPTVQ